MPPVAAHDLVAPVRRWLAEYARGFVARDPAARENVELKLAHTLRVWDESRGLARELELDRADRGVAELAALVHDVGRFEQYARWGTFVDARSADHAALGATLLRERDLLDGLAVAERRLVLDLVAWHNRRHLPDDAPPRSRRLARLLRDADKLDIWRVVLEHYERADGRDNPTLELDLPETPGTSPAVRAALRDGRLVDRNDLRNRNDFKLLQLGWIYDVNFAPSFRRIRERRYLERLRAALPASAELDRIFARARAHARRGAGDAPGTPRAAGG